MSSFFKKKKNASKGNQKPSEDGTISADLMRTMQENAFKSIDAGQESLVLMFLAKEKQIATMDVATEDSNKTILINATCKLSEDGCIKVVDAIVEVGGAAALRVELKKKTKNTTGNSPLHNAAKQNYGAFFEKVIGILDTDNGDGGGGGGGGGGGREELRKVLNLANEEGETPLYGAASVGATKVVKVLLENDLVDASPPHPQKATPLHVAAAFAGMETLSLLLAKRGEGENKDKTDVNVADENNFTPLLLACKTGNSRVIAALVEAGADMYHPIPEVSEFFFGLFNAAADL